jgi:plasmid maintenance system antidote protein VapI
MPFQSKEKSDVEPYIIYGLIKKHGKSVKDVADNINKDYSHLNKVLNGHIKLTKEIETDILKYLKEI